MLCKDGIFLGDKLDNVTACNDDEVRKRKTERISLVATRDTNIELDHERDHRSIAIR